MKKFYKKNAQGISNTQNEYDNNRKKVEELENRGKFSKLHTFFKESSCFKRNPKRI